MLMERSIFRSLLGRESLWLEKSHGCSLEGTCELERVVVVDRLC